ncbi:MAG TPA: alpha-glucuronidase family glycosyl hydrolase [Terriglobales bacterium]|nr:alpha-glucuronidase family glycosyl hydrolase [Terriglobales bacterium]
MKPTHGYSSPLYSFIKSTKLKTFCGRLAVVTILLLLAFPAFAETGKAGWLRYARLDAVSVRFYSTLPATTVLVGDTPILNNAQNEVVLGIQGMLGRTLRMVKSAPTESAIVIGTADGLKTLGFTLPASVKLSGDGYYLALGQVKGFKSLIVTGQTERGVLYGSFALLRKIAQGQKLDVLNEAQSPSAPIRWTNEWDNLDGSIERGYAGKSIFFENRKVREDLSLVSEYARLLASVGINGCNVSNVNADLHILDPDFIPQLARIADAMRPWGVQLGVAVNVSMPKQVGGLDTFDPLDPKVASWWSEKFNVVYRQIPDFGGVVVKADSEGQLGPSVYGRGPVEAANVIAKALKPHKGVVFYRAFVYNHHLDWNDMKADRARAAYDIFHPLDGKFEDNVIIQIKHGPIDFQVREPASPLFGGLEKTNQAIELQVTQEYLGQQKHTVFIVPMWKEVLDFDMRVNGRRTPVKEILSGRAFQRPIGGYVGVVNVGLDENWLGNHLAMANLYGYGRLAWNPDLTSQEIIDEWTRLTFNNEPTVVQTVSQIQLASWPVYETYTGILGLQTLTNITGAHYGPAPESQERNGWGQWIRAEKDAVGMDRTVATGTGYAGQYWPEVAKMYEKVETTPEDLILFFHHLPYTYKLKSGKTIIQTIYDSHYQGAERVRDFVAQWKTLHGKIDDGRYFDVLNQLKYQSGHAIVWRDAVNDWFRKVSGIADAKGRVGNHPNRTEAEALALTGYAAIDVTPWEGASGGGKAIACAEPNQSCTAEVKFKGKPGWYEIDVEYFDQRNGVSTYRVFVGSQLLDAWKADLHLPATKPNADSSTRRRIKGIALRPGDMIRIEGVPDGAERAALDYIEIIPETE